MLPAGLSEYPDDCSHVELLLIESRITAQKGDQIILHDACCKTNTVNIPVAVKSCQDTAHTHTHALTSRPECMRVPAAMEPGTQSLLEAAAFYSE